MTAQSAQSAQSAQPARPADFDVLLAEVTAAAGRFGRREHVRLTWPAVRRFGAAEAVALVGDGIRRTATAAGAPQKYHETVTRAWVELVGHYAAEDGGADFAAFVDRCPDLLDKGLPARFYRPETPAGDRAKADWVEPDLAPFSRRRADRPTGVRGGDSGGRSVRIRLWGPAWP
ncbi:hypothetical protein [Kitasatospora sp. NPDC091207]|uniref:hypothetical protein n=1 Tax=Kitasatospora sp. NPDC091207 TaxID=3364083 RepID=UPI0037FDA4BF